MTKGEEYKKIRHEFASLIAEDVKELMLDYPNPPFKTFGEYLTFERHLTNWFKRGCNES